MWLEQWCRYEFEIGKTGPTRKWGNVFRRSSPLFLALKVQCQYSLASFLFVAFLLTVPPMPSHL